MMRDEVHSKVNKKLLRKLNNFAFSFVKEKIDFHSSCNSIYSFNSLFKAIIFCSIMQRYLENGVKRLKELASFAIPDADTFTGG